jgi:hypothetical protein
MPAFDQLANDRVHVRKADGTQSGPFKAVVSSGTDITIFDETADVAEGDILTRTLPGGREEAYHVLEATFSQGLSNIPATWRMRVRKTTLPAPTPRHSSITIHSAQAVQIGDSNLQTVIGTLQLLAQSIDSSDAPETDKAEARSRLKRLLEHPLVSSLLGAAAGAVVSRL